MKRAGVLEVSHSGELPAELQRSIPREVTLTALGRFAVAGAIVLVVTAIGFTVATSRWAAQDRELRRRIAEEGRVATGSVLTSRRTSGKNAQRIVDYEFEARGSVIRGRTQLKLSGSETYPARSAVSIGYLENRPEMNWIVGHPPKGFPTPVFIIEILGSLVGAYAIWWQLRRQRLLLAEGRAVLARVKRVEQARKGDKRVQRITYEFKLMSGAMREGHYDVQRNAPGVGAMIAILYDKDDEKRQTRYPTRLYRIRKG